MLASLLLFGASTKPCGLWEFTGWWVQVAWRKRGGTTTYTFCVLGGSTFPWDLHDTPTHLTGQGHVLVDASRNSNPGLLPSAPSPWLFCYGITADVQ